MNWNEAANVLANNLVAQVNGLKSAAMLWGPPGVGKSDMVLAAAERLSFDTGKNLPVIEIRLSTLANVDVRGLPYRDPQDGTVKFSKPFFISDQPAVYFFDEVNTAPPSNQVVAYEIALNHRIGGHELAEGSVVIMAGNRSTDRGATFSMPVPLRNRLQHITVEPDVDTTFKYGLANGWDTSVLGFLKFKSSLLFQAPSGDQEAFPTPRSWAFVNAILPYDSSAAAIAGFVGEGAASEFLAFRRLAGQLPDLDKVLKEGTPFSHPDLSVMYAYVVGLVQALLRAPAKKEYIVNYSNLIGEVGKKHAELIPLAVLGLRDTKHNSEAVKYPEFRKFFAVVNGTLAV